MWLLFADAELRSGVLGTLAAHNWLGFDQDQSQAYPLQWFEGHPTQRGWSKHELKTLGLRLSVDPGQTVQAGRVPLGPVERDPARFRLATGDALAVDETPAHVSTVLTGMAA